MLRDRYPLHEPQRSSYASPQYSLPPKFADRDYLIDSMEASALKRKDTTKGPPLRVLSLDGGGVRGYSMLIIIQELMHRTYVEVEGNAPRRSQIPKPCDHFDLIVGTGTGGLIALMLGRLRLDIETCKELYVRLTRMVFETDKTIAGIPYRSTLFKASRLEEAIRDCVREHTVYEQEGNDGAETDVISPLTPANRSSGSYPPRRNPSNASVVSFSARSPQAQMARTAPSNSKWGNPNARLYDERENRTKTAVTAVYKGSQKGALPVLLRSYDSRAEAPPEFDCKIWEAGRATSAIGLAFKAIQIGQSQFHDDGAGNFNPSVYALDEATVNEWPGRDVGVFVSVGTGKRPKSSDTNQSQWYEGFLGEFAEARKRLIAKIEGCETIHEYVRKEHLVKRGVNVENYYRFNVEIGVGEFGMNEWNRLADISTGTKRYLQRPEERNMVHSAAVKLSKVYRAKQRWDRLADVPESAVVGPAYPPPAGSRLSGHIPDDISAPLAVELPGDIPAFWPPPLPPSAPARHSTPPSRSSYESGNQDHLSVPTGPGTPSPRNSGERLHPAGIINSSPGHHSSAGPPPPPPRPRHQPGGSPRLDDDHLVVEAPTPAQYRYHAAGNNNPQTGSPIVKQSAAAQLPYRIEPPPLPPKTPLLESQRRLAPAGPPVGAGNTGLPYPLDDDAPPPVVSSARKPEFRGR